ncbi:hypothetical protein ACFL0R_07745 [Pseudomonadota bacterium]
MDFYIQVGPDDTASILDSDGRIQCIFPSATAARYACKDWYCIHETHPLVDTKKIATVIYPAKLLRQEEGLGETH